ncbi:hypothetical protein WH7805_01452 [Synechococcus sp. WH 7805]|nr:hypothetical protein WH7805_01452 [Synechococcus sp. WH 7805]
MDRLIPSLHPMQFHSTRFRLRSAMAFLGLLTLVGVASARAHHVPGDDHSGMVLSGQPQQSDQTAGGKKAMFDTRKEAEAAAPGFGCKGAHAMGSKWMPCESHGHGMGI